MSATDQIVLTPRVRTRLRRGVLWITLGALTLLFALLGLLTAGSVQDPTTLDPETPGPVGSKAVAEVLRQQGIDVTSATRLRDATRAIDDPSNTTVLVYDPDTNLTTEQYQSIAETGVDVVIVEPGFLALQALAPSVASAGTVTGPVDATCTDPVGENSGRITSDGQGYRVVDGSVPAVTCFTSDDGASSLVRVSTAGGSTVTVFGAGQALTNDYVARLGNAGLALTMLGSDDSLVWYLPSLADTDATTAPTLEELTPSWLTPATILVAITVLTLVLWRGRRMGRLVIENLPVTVRASETMEGRARLYASSGARLHALDSLRIGTVDRLARACGLPRLATVDDVVASVASVTGRKLADVRGLLVETEPANDRDLVRLSDQLLTLEADVARAVRPQ